MNLIVDTSMILAWYFPDEGDDKTIACLDHVTEFGAIVPAHWHSEVANGLLMGVRRNRVDEKYCNQILEKLADFVIEIDDDSAVQTWNRTFKIAVQYSLTVYDASYLELAQRKRLPLATLDKALRRATIQAGTPVFGEAK